MMSDITTYTKWDDIPDGVATKTTLNRDYGLKVTKDQKPVARKKRFNHRGKHVGYYDLYLADDCTPKRKPTQAQIEALSKARHMAEKLIVTCSCCKQEQWGRYAPITVTRKQWLADDYDAWVCRHCRVRQAAVKTAQDLLEYGDFVVMDTETADLHGQIIQIAIIDSAGEPLLNTLVKPTCAIESGASAIHGLTLVDLQDAPSFADVYPQIAAALQGRVVCIYNASYDVSVLNADCRRHGLDLITYDSVCIMELYARYCGQWSSRYDSYKWQPLQGDHSAIGDSLACLRVIHSMTRGDDD